MPTGHWHQHYCWPSGLSKYRMHSQNFHSQLIRPPFPRGSRLNKIHPRGNPAIVRSIPTVFPQHSYPHPLETRGFRGIPAVPIRCTPLVETLRIMGWDTLVYMVGQFGLSGWTVRYLGAKCLLDTPVLCRNVRTLRTHLNSAKVSQCQYVPRPKCAVTAKLD